MFFFTVVTAGRRPILTTDVARACLRGVVGEVRGEHPFAVEAWVLLPDHLHCIWTLPDGDMDFSKRWGLIKAGFSKRSKGVLEDKSQDSASRSKHRESTIWQRRFWEHRIRNEEDYRRHMDYIHFNPVKHGLAEHVWDWPYSTFHRYVEAGVYPVNWGSETRINVAGEFGE
jgi:putative transposase